MTRATDLSAESFEVAASVGASLIEVELVTSGYAQVIALVAPDQGSGLALRSEGRASTVAAALSVPSAPAEVRAVAADLERYFSVPATSQDASLALALGGVRPTSTRAGRVGRERRARRGLEVPVVHVYPHIGVILGTVDVSGVQALRADPRVLDLQPAPPVSLIRPKTAAAAKKSVAISWGVERLRAPELWRAGFTGKGIVVGHLDTGVDGSHPALKKAISSFAEFDLVGKKVANAKAHDTGDHGTHTAGTIVGRKVGKSQFGVAPGATLASAIVIEGGNVIARILAGMDWAVASGARVLNMSLGLRGYNPAFLTLTRALRARGVLPVFAVGNEGPGTSRSPGNYVEALSVGASDVRDQVAYFSGSQRFSRAKDPLVPDLVAPGVDVLSCVPKGRYAKMSGSSMATPHVAGLAALLFEASPSASIDEVEQAIFGSCVLSPRMEPERANRGIPDAAVAYALLTGNPLPERPKRKPSKAKKSRKAAQRTKAKRKRP